MSATACSGPAAHIVDANGQRWARERVLFALAGSMTLISVALAALISPWLLLLTAFVGVDQRLYVLFGARPDSLALRRPFSLHSALYPRQQASS
jgi:hypothetical protein